MDDKPVHFSRRESQVVALIYQGFANKEIASAMRIVEGSVKTHANRIFKKMHVESRTQLMAHRIRELERDLSDRYGDASAAD